MSDDHTYPRFSDAEYARRHSEVRQRMDRVDVQALVLFGQGRSADIGYLSNWRTTTEAWLVFPREGDATLFVQLSNHLPNARLMAIVEDVRFGGSSASGSVDSVPSVVANLRDRGLVRGRIGLVGPVPYQYYGRLHDALPGIELVDFSAEMRDQRQVKSDEEIEWLRASARMSDRSVEALATAARPGITEHALARIVEDAYLGEGGVNQIHFMVSTSMHDPSAGVPRQYMSDRVLKTGDVLLTEISANRFGYVAQILRTFTINEEPTEEYGRMHEVAVEAFHRAEAALRPGATVEDILDAAEVVHERGYAIYDDFMHGEGQLPPIVRTRQTHRGEPTDFSFRENMCYVIQPNVVSEDATRGVQFGEMVRITAEGVERLHAYPRELIVCRNA